MDLPRETWTHTKQFYLDRMNPSGVGTLVLAVAVALLLGGLWLARRRRTRRHPQRDLGRDGRW